MAMNLNSKKKLCKVLSNGPIPELGNITGPVLYPTKIPMNKVINMVQHGRKVLEVNPKNYSQTVLLNIKNVMSNNFPEPEKYVNVPTQVETKVEKPVQPEQPKVEESLAKTLFPNVEPPKVEEVSVPAVEDVTENVTATTVDSSDIIITPITTTPETAKSETDPTIVPDFNSYTSNQYKYEYNGNNGGKKKHRR